MYIGDYGFLLVLKLQNNKLRVSGFDLNIERVKILQR